MKNLKFNAEVAPRAPQSEWGTFPSFVFTEPCSVEILESERMPGIRTTSSGDEFCGLVLTGKNSGTTGVVFISIPELKYLSKNSIPQNDEDEFIEGSIAIFTKKEGEVAITWE